jgi:hypothetical protein
MANVSTVRKIGILGRVLAEQAGRSRTGGALIQAGRATLSHVGHVMHTLWLEVTGFVFLGIALIAGAALWGEYAEYHAGKIGPGRALLAGGVTLMFAWFGLSSFWKARWKSRSKK